MIETLPSGIRLKNLIQNHHAEILVREKNNEKFVHLYNIGAYWVAFERSAYRLETLFPRCELTLFRVLNGLDYVVMVSVPSIEINDYFCEHAVYHDELNYKILIVLPIAAKLYNRWRMDAVKSIL